MCYDLDAFALITSCGSGKSNSSVLSGGDHTNNISNISSNQLESSSSPSFPKQVVMQNSYSVNNIPSLNASIIYKNGMPLALNPATGSLSSTYGGDPGVNEVASPIVVGNLFLADNQYGI